MEKLPAIVLSILAVVVIFGVVIFGGVAPAIEDKSDEIITEMDGLDFNGTP